MAAQPNAALAAARVQLPALLPPPAGCVCHRRGHVRPGLRGGTCCRPGVRDRHSPPSVCNEWGPDHSGSAALAALGSSHPFLEPEWTLGAQGLQAREKTSTGNLHSLSGGGQVCRQPRLGLLTASHAGEAHPALPRHRANPRGGLTCTPQPAFAQTAPAPPGPACGLESHRRAGAHRAHRRCFSFKRKPSPSALGGCGLHLEREDSCLRLRAGSPRAKPTGNCS